MLRNHLQAQPKKTAPDTRADSRRDGNSRHRAACTRAAGIALAAAAALAACSDAGAPAPVAVDCSAAAATAGVSFVGARDQDACVWRGLRYAEPPVGALRFRPAVLRPASGTIAATAFGNDCIQGASPMAEQTIDEDCLTLNVWTPGTSADGNLQRNLPVMVWFYGGGYTQGSANWSMYHGAPLAREAMVLVAVNYRLGALGGAAPRGVTDSDGMELKGNLHLSDQWAALEWVQDHVAAFGGNPDNVTVFGESAGGWSVCSLLGAGAASAGLLQRAIMQSGACIFATATAAGDFSDAWLARTGCPPHGPAALACLRTLDDQVFADRYTLGLRTGAYPNVDGELLAQQPLVALSDGVAAGVDFLAGFNHDELEIAALADFDLIGFRFQDWDAFWADVEAELSAADRAALQNLYPQADFATPFDLGQAMIVDQVFGCNARNAVAAQTKHAANTYMYRFALEPESFSVEPYVGSFHGLDVPFVFGAFHWAAPLFSNDGLEEALAFSARIRRYWTRFAATGNPNGLGLDGSPDPDWPRFGSDAFAMELRPNASVTAHFLSDRCAFWNERVPGDFNGMFDWVTDHIPGVEDASFFKRR